MTNKDWQVIYMICDMLLNWWLQNMDEAQSSPGLHAAAGTGLAEECATLVCYCLFVGCHFIFFHLTSKAGEA